MIGIGVGIGFSSSPPWTPAALGALYSWLDPGSGLARHTQPTIADADMEAAGVAAWLSGGGATLTKEGNAHSGAQCLRIANAGAGSARQAALITGCRYAASGWVRGDGVTGVPSVNDAVVNFFVGTASNAWQPFSVEATWQTGSIYTVISGGGYIEADDYSASNLSIASWTPRLGTVLTPVAQATAASMQWRTTIAGKYGIRGDGAADQSTSGASASVYPLHKASGCLVGLTVNTDTAAAGNDYLIDTLGDAAANVGVGIYHDATNSLIGFRVGNGSGAYVVDATAACSKNATHAVVCSYDGTNFAIYIDGVAVTTGAGVGVASAADATNALRIGARSGVAALWHQGAIGQIVLAPYSAAQAALSAWLAANPWGEP